MRDFDQTVFMLRSRIISFAAGSNTTNFIRKQSLRIGRQEKQHRAQVHCDRNRQQSTGISHAVQNFISNPHTSLRLCNFAQLLKFFSHVLCLRVS